MLALTVQPKQKQKILAIVYNASTFEARSEVTHALDRFKSKENQQSINRYTAKSIIAMTCTTALGLAAPIGSMIKACPAGILTCSTTAVAAVAVVGTLISIAFGLKILGLSASNLNAQTTAMDKLLAVELMTLRPQGNTAEPSMDLISQYRSLPAAGRKEVHRQLDLHQANEDAGDFAQTAMQNSGIPQPAAVDRALETVELGNR